MMAAVELTTQRLRHYSTLEYLLLGDLREILEEELDEENRRWLMVLLDALLDMLPREFELEEAGGYLIEVVEYYPNWAEQVDSLRDQHTTLIDELQQLRTDLVQLVPEHVRTATIREELKSWSNAVTAHNRHETRLMQVAINLEVGVGD